MKISRNFLSALFVVMFFCTSAQGDIQNMKDWLYDAGEIDLNGFLEARNGWRLQNDINQKDASLAEIRLQLDMAKDLGWGQLKIKGDLLADFVTDDYAGELRDLNLLFSPLDMVDMKIGRQVLTWGTGDLLFINDLFPKDWKSFFIDRDDEYLKAPSDAVKMSIFLDLINIDLVYVPVFTGSSYIEGERLSSWNPMFLQTTGRNYIFEDEERNSMGRDSEFALRLSQNVGGLEVALYSYSGFWNTPEGQNPVNRKLVYPRLSVYGASLRGSLLGGIGNIETGYYDSRQDRDGTDPLLRNSEIRFLAGFERELARNLTGSLQYYLEWMQDYHDYEQALDQALPGSPHKDEKRSLLTVRLTKLMLNQNLKLSLFVYYSPTDKDAYMRPKVHYKVTDSLSVEAGGNIFMGSEDYTFWGQFEDNTNAYGGVRWNF